ncbi:MAG: antibiotic biosynthesis monooxygenase [Deltaproteobacteria bacterium]|nr:antibiotic biosynthesis monooxygenase [Deltaproteobacteria bacterium]
MAIKTLIKRRIPENFNDPRFNDLIRQLRVQAVAQKGFISGETLRRVGDPREYLVLGTWQNIATWEAWKASPIRMEIQKQIDALLGTPTDFAVYEYPYVEK